MNCPCTCNHKQSTCCQGASEKAVAPRTMRTLRVNERARIARLAAQGETARRMRDLGLRPGVEFSVVGRAPLVDPVAIQVGQSVLTLRNNEADCVLVEAVES